MVTALWDSWSDDAVVDDRAGGQYAGRIDPPDQSQRRALPGGWTTEYAARPQGRPVLVQAGSSDIGRRFAARHAEAVFTAHMEKATAQEFYADLRHCVAPRAAAEQIMILPGISPVIGSTAAEAERMSRELNDLCDPEVGRKRLSGRFGGHDFSHLPLDRPLSPKISRSRMVEAARSRTEVIVGLVRREKPTLRQLLGNMAGARGHLPSPAPPIRSPISSRTGSATVPPMGST